MTSQDGEVGRPVLQDAVIPGPAARVDTVIGVDAGSVSLAAADHLVYGVAAGVPEGAVVCTHLVRDEEAATTAISLALPSVEAAEALWAMLVTEPALVGAGLVFGGRTVGPRGAVERARSAVAECVGGDGGRAVLFPGWAALTGEVSVSRLLSESAIGGLVVVGAPEGEMVAEVMQTRGHVRPQWRGGRLVLAVTSSAEGKLAPFEVPNPTPCCADH